VFPFLETAIGEDDELSVSFDDGFFLLLGTAPSDKDDELNLSFDWVFLFLETALSDDNDDEL